MSMGISAYELDMLGRDRHKERRREAERLCLLRSLRGEGEARNSELGAPFLVRLQAMWLSIWVHLQL